MSSFHLTERKSPGVAVRLLVALLALLACLALAIAAVPTQAAPHGHHHHRHHVKAHRMYWGAWIGDQLTGTAPPWDMRAGEQLERIVHKSMSLVEFSSPFQECQGGNCANFAFPTQQMEAIRNHGSIPLFSWGSEVVPREGVNQPQAQLANIISGADDGYLHEVAAAAAAWGHPFFLRFDWEMNGNWMPWSEQVNGNHKGQYVAAWRHVHDVFTAAGATNATWVWCPYADEKGKYPDIARYYPGSRYVDWTCLDGYNWGQNSVNPQKWKSFDQLFSNSYRELTRKVAPAKPVMLGELASNSAGGHKGAWIRNMFRRLPRAYPRVRALVWFDTVDRGVDWPLETSGSAARAFRHGIASKRYAGSSFAGIEQRPITPLH